MHAAALNEEWKGGHARVRITHRRPYDYDEKRGIYLLKRADDDEVIEGVPFKLLSKQEVWNQITNVGRAQIHKGGYGTSGLPTNGFNYIALSNDTVSETASSTTLSTEIAANGLSRAQGTVVLATGAGTQTTIDKTFTASGSQSCQKAALFDAASTGNMNHVLAFTQRALITSDTIQVTFTITLA